MHSCKVQVHSISTDKALLLNSQPPTLKTWLQCSQTSHHPRHKIKSLNERTSFVIALLDCTFLEKKPLPCQATTAALLPGRLGSGLGYSSYPDWARPHGWLNRALCRTRHHPATGARVTSTQTHAHATAQSRALREEGELVCNKVTPVGQK